MSTNTLPPTSHPLISPHPPLPPLSPPISPIITSPDAPPRPSLSRMRSHASHRRRPSLSTLVPPTLRAKFHQHMHHLYRAALSTWSSATLTQRLLFLLAVTVFSTITLLFLIYSHRLFSALLPLAARWRALPFGWLLIFAAIFTTAFPPIIGYSSCLTLAGFLYGMRGWFICASATILGSLASFLASRTVLAGYVHALVGGDKRFTAFALTLKHDGVPILVMIRLCPLPYSLSNGALSTFPTVSTLAFAVATAAATPKLLVHVFVGSRLAAIAEAGGEMDVLTRIINYASILGFGVLGAGVGYVIYQKTVDRARQIEEEESRVLVDREGGYFEGIAEEEEGEEETDALVHGEFGDDDISLWDNDEPGVGEGGYRDEWTDEEGGARRGEVLDEEAAVETARGDVRS